MNRSAFYAALRRCASKAPPKKDIPMTTTLQVQERLIALG